MSFILNKLRVALFIEEFSKIIVMFGGVILELIKLPAQVIYKAFLLIDLLLQLLYLDILVEYYIILFNLHCLELTDMLSVVIF